MHAQTKPEAPQQPPAKTIDIEQRDKILLIGIDRVASGNTLDPETFISLGKAFYQLDNISELRVGVLYAKGPDFLPGIDVPLWSRTPISELYYPNVTEFVNPFNTVPPNRVKPVVVAVQGATKHGGHELFLASDVRVAASDTVFSQAEAARALFPSCGATVRFVREAGWGNAMRYMLTGEDWGADEAYRMGLVQAVTPPGEQLDMAISIAQKIADAAPLGVAATLKSARRGLAEGEAAVFVNLLNEFAPLFRTEDFQERVRALSEKRSPNYKGR
jgi:enoyl-CoA hydratase/carnithine racemase